jgi:hypothetical protein
MNNLSKLIFLKYNEKGESKTGIIKIKFNYNIEDHTLNYAGIDYSDNNIQSFVERNPYVLSKIDFQMNDELMH